MSEKITLKRIDTLLRPALDLFSAGYNTIPVVVLDKTPVYLQKEHKPHLLNWKQWQSFKMGSDVVIDLFTLTSDNIHGIAIITGGVNNLECIDFDPKISTIELKLMLDKFRETGIKFYCESTQSGGFHIIYRTEVKQGNRKLAQRRLSDGKVVTFIETRGDAGYVVIAPSRGYKELENSVSLSQLPMLTEDERNTLIDLSLSYNEVLTPHKELYKPKYDLSPYNDSEEAFNTSVGLLEAEGWKYAYSHSNRDEYIRPGKTKGISAGFIDKKVFYVFSSNCDPFEQGCTYSHSQILNLLKYKGNWKDTCRDLGTRNLIVVRKDNNFWHSQVKEDKNGVPKVTLHIDSTKFIEFIESQGYSKIYTGFEYKFIKTKANIIEETDINQIHDFVFNYIDSLAEPITEEQHTRSDLKNLFLNKINHYFCEKFLLTIKPSQNVFKRDTKDKCFLFYRNCWVEVDKEGYEVKKYEDLDKAIWNTQILTKGKTFRTFTYEGQCPDDFMYRKFIENICKNDEQRILSLQSAIGFMIHTYKNPSLAKAVILCDEGDVDQDSDDACGRSGKSLVANTTLSKMRNLVSEDGKAFDFERSFCYQKVKLDTQIYCFDDVKKSFRFDNLFSVITGNMDIEKKRQDTFSLPFPESPKIILSTNFTVTDESDSSKARKFEIEFSKHYNSNHTPLDEFGTLFFEGWDDTQWGYFDAYMMECVMIFLKYGLCKYEFVSLKERRMKQITGQDFVDLMRSEEIVGEYDKLFITTILTDFNRLYANNYTYKITPKHIRKWLKLYCDTEGFKISSEKQETSGERRGQRFVSLVKI